MLSRPQRNILVVDDEESFRFGVEQLLQQRGYQVASARSAEHALDVLEKRQIDVVITDIKMPGMDGFELVQWLRKHRPSVRVLMTTGFDSLQAREQSKALGAVSYLAKPVDLGELTDRLQRLFAGGGWSGTVEDLSLSESLQLLVSTRKDKTLEVSSLPNRVGRIYLKEGQIVHAEAEGRRGLDAFFEILSWPSGGFTEIPTEAPAERTLHESTSWLLLEAARRKDEVELKGAEVKAAGQTPDPPPDPWRSEQTLHYWEALKGVESVRGIQGALLLSREGRVLATRGSLPDRIETVILPYCEGCDQLGRDLGLGRYDEAVLHLSGGFRLLIEPLGDLLLGVRISRDADMADVRGWIRGVAWRAGGRVR